jgi:uncharacterized protein YxeA
MELVIIGLTSVILIGAGALIALFSWRAINTDDLASTVKCYVREKEAASVTRNLVSSSREESGGLAAQACTAADR